MGRQRDQIDGMVARVVENRERRRANADTRISLVPKTSYAIGRVIEIRLRFRSPLLSIWSSSPNRIRAGA